MKWNRLTIETSKKLSSYYYISYESFCITISFSSTQTPFDIFFPREAFAKKRKIMNKFLETFPPPLVSACIRFERGAIGIFSFLFSFPPFSPRSGERIFARGKHRLRINGLNFEKETEFFLLLLFFFRSRERTRENSVIAGIISDDLQRGLPTSDSHFARV